MIYFFISQVNSVIIQFSKTTFSEFNNVKKNKEEEEKNKQFMQSTDMKEAL